jgi:hypothetical protein
MSCSRRGGTKPIYCAGRGKMKGDMSIWSTSHFRINAMRATKSLSPFVINVRCAHSTSVSDTRKREMHIIRARLILGPSP